MKSIISFTAVVLLLSVLLCIPAKQVKCQTASGFQVTPLSMRFDYREVSDSSLNVLSDIPWTAETNAKWIKLSRLKGEGSCRITIVVLPNIEAEGRSASVIFKPSGGKAVTVVIFQKALHEE